MAADASRPEDFDVTGWKIAFAVSLDMSKLEPGSDAEKRAKDAINQAGDFSISSLFLVFNGKISDLK